MYSIWYYKTICNWFCFQRLSSWKCICSRPICVEAITAERGNKSVPNEKLPESGQLPPDLQDLPQVTNLFHCSAQELGGGWGLSSIHLLPKTELRCANIFFLHVLGSDRRLDFYQLYLAIVVLLNHWSNNWACIRLIVNCRSIGLMLNNVMCHLCQDDLGHLFPTFARGCIKGLARMVWGTFFDIHPFDRGGGDNKAIWAMPI